MGSSVLGALLGRKTISKTNVSKATTAAKAASRAAQQRGDVSQAGDSLEVLQQKYADLQAKFQAKIEELDAALRPEALELEACSASAQENGHHRRASRPGLDAVSRRGRGEAGAGVLTVNEKCARGGDRGLTGLGSRQGHGILRYARE